MKRKGKEEEKKELKKTTSREGGSVLYLWGCKDKQVKKDGRGGGGVCWGWIYVCWIAGIPESETTVTDRLGASATTSQTCWKVGKSTKPWSRLPLDGAELSPNSSMRDDIAPQYAIYLMMRKHARDRDLVKKAG